MRRGHAAAAPTDDDDAAAATEDDDAGIQPRAGTAASKHGRGNGSGVIAAACDRAAAAASESVCR